MIAGELTSYRYVADLTAQLQGGAREQFQNVSGDITAVPSSASAVATTAAFSAVTSRLDQGWRDLQSVALEALDIFA